MGWRNLNELVDVITDKVSTAWKQTPPQPAGAAGGPLGIQGAQRAFQAKGVRVKVHSRKGCHFVRRKWGSLVLPHLSTQRGAGLHGRKVAMLAEIR